MKARKPAPAVKQAAAETKTKQVAEPAQAAAAPAVVLGPEQLGYILNGACILGSGGGGPISVGQQVIQQIGNHPVTLVSADSVSATAMTAVSAFVGSPDAAANQELNFSVATSAFNALARNVNKTFSYVLPGEVGAGNSLIPMVVAVENDIPIIDAAGACRAIPGFLMVTYAAAGIPASPMVLTDGKSPVTVSCGNPIADPVVRGIISGGAFQQDAGIAFWSMNGQTMNQAAIKGMTTLAMNIGQALAKAIIYKTDPVAAVRAYMTKPNYILCTGKIVSASETTSGGFDFGTVVIKADDGSTITIYNQNENLIAFSDQSPAPLAMGPDLICYLTKNGQAFSNADIDDEIKQQEVVVIGVPAPTMRSAFIINQFMIALAGIGYAGPYVPIEQLNAQRIAA
jgi:DUF917 family protein